MHVFLFQDEMNTWIGRLNAASGGEATSPSKSQTMPASSSEKATDKKGFLTMKKK